MYDAKKGGEGQENFFHTTIRRRRHMWHNTDMCAHARILLHAFLLLCALLLGGKGASAQIAMPTDQFPDPPLSPLPCNTSTEVVLYYDKSRAVPGGIVPFRITIGADDFDRISDNPKLLNAGDAVLEISDAGSSSLYEGVIRMRSASSLELVFTLQCSGPGGYDFSDALKTYTWEIPDSPEEDTGIGIASIAKHVTPKNIAIGAVGLGVVATIPTIAFNLFPQLAHMLQYLGAFFSVSRRKSRWGIVVDSDIGKPVAHAVVQVFDAKFNQLKETQVTGKDGQFGFLLPAGSYYVVASKTGFVFPARKKPPTVLHENEKLYLGQELEIDDKDPNKIPHLVVPMDREEKIPLSQLVARRYLERVLALVDRVGFVFLFLGAGINTYFFITGPWWLNILFEVLYLILFILKLYIMLTHQKGLGDVVDSETGKPLDLAILRLYDAKTNRLIQTRVTNVYGRFFLLVPKGTYTASVAKPGYATSLQENLTIAGSSSQALALHFKLAKEQASASAPEAPQPPKPPQVASPLPLHS